MELFETETFSEAVGQKNAQGLWKSPRKQVANISPQNGCRRECEERLRRNGCAYFVAHSHRGKLPLAGEWLKTRLERYTDRAGVKEFAHGFDELLRNAHESGNFGLDGPSRRALARAGRLEEVISRLEDGDVKLITVRLLTLPGEAQVIVQDQGAGFDYHRYLAGGGAESHEGGIRRCARFFDQLWYCGGGSVACAVKKLE